MPCAPEPNPQKAGEPRIGVYVCHCGGNISDKVNVEKVASAASRLAGVQVARTDTFMCSDPGQALIVEDIAKHHLNRIVVASCSPSLHETTFRRAVIRGGLNPFLYEHVNVREQVSWVHSSIEDATRKASTLVDAAVARVGKHQPLSPIRVGAASRALVVGGGAAGLRAAIDLADFGLPVTLVEKNDRLGGHLNDLPAIFPTGRRGDDLVDRLVDQLRARESITVLTSAGVTGASGYVGNFDVEIRQTVPVPTNTDRPVRETSVHITVGAIVVATGFTPYEPAKGEFAYGRSPQVVTLPQFLQLLAKAAPGQNRRQGHLVVDGREIRRAAFIHCVGSRQIEGIHKPKENGRLNVNCSRVCCTATLKAENDLIERFPKTAVYDFYRDIRTYGRGHEEIYEQAARNGVVFLRYEPETPPTVKKRSNGLVVTVEDGLTWGETVEVGVDLVVLTVGMEPAEVGSLAESLKLPTGSDGFLQEVHPKLRPVEVAVAGVVLAGTCQSPRDITESCASASASAVKVAGLLSRGYVELDPYVARVDPLRCDGTGACLEECEYQGALQIVSTEVDGQTVRRAAVNEALCVGCGACAAVCPNHALDVNGWTLDQFRAMVDAICAVPEEVMG